MQVFLEAMSLVGALPWKELPFPAKDGLVKISILWNSVSDWPDSTFF